MGLTSAVRWWEESQMRVLVLSSLVIQFLLLIFSFARRYAIHKLFRFIMWIAYLASDAVAIYALATLFNRHKDQDRGGSSTLELEVLWAPILLIHLGGHDGITAFNIEDNELWSRHLLTALSQITVAIYVFCKSWPPGGDKRILQAAILLFVPGVLKCIVKPLALERASINNLVSSPAANRTAKKGEAAGEMDPNWLVDYVKRAKAFVQEQKAGGRASPENGDHPPPAEQEKQNEDQMDPFEVYVKGARDTKPTGQKDEEERAREEDTKPTGGLRRRWKQREMILHGEAYKLFVDLSSLHPRRRFSIFKYFWVLSDEKAYGSVRQGLASAFLLLYTKLKIAGIPTENDFQRSPKLGDLLKLMFRQWVQMLRMYLPWAAIGVFHHSQREAYNDTDVKITYALLCCTAVLEAYSFFPILFTNMNASSVGNPLIISREQWPEVVAQYSLIGYFARNKNHSKIMGILSNIGCKDLVDQHWCMKPCLSSARITASVLQYLKDGWENKITDVTTYRRFSDNRGHWALEGNQDLGWSIKGQFDRCVLLWHIATDFCFFSSPFSEHTCAFPEISDVEKEGGTPPAQGTRSKCGEFAACKAVQCRQMSNYLVYLLFVNPEMLLSGTRRKLFTTAYDELEVILRDNTLNPLSCCQQVEEKDIMEILAKTMKDRSHKEDPNIGCEEESMGGQSKGGGSTGNFIDDAWHLAQGLFKLREDDAFGEDKMWEMIHRVWVEMLCFSASRCRGYLHAKALSSGGEFLSYVWLLLLYMGMETLPERLQRDELPSSEGSNGAAPTTSDTYDGRASSISKVHTNVSTSSENHVTGEELV